MAADNATLAEKKRIKEEKRKLKEETAKQKKEVKKRAKEIAAQEASLAEDEESNGFFTLLVTTAIVVVWLGILAWLVHMDVGGFGSTVLTPILKDVPVINKILPKSSVIETDNGEVYGGYTSLKDAVEQIRYLELELQKYQETAGTQGDTIVELQAEVARLKEFEDMQVEFQRIKTEFYEEVVYASKGPGADEYVKYYESMDPTTAEYLYQQVIVQQQEDAEIEDYARAYSEMKPKEAAAIFEAMEKDLTLPARILGVMNAQNRGAILGAMDATIAAKITKIMDPDS